jgi:hypothetical protein
MTQDAASPAAASGRDLFFSKSAEWAHLSATATIPTRTT